MSGQPTLFEQPPRLRKPQRKTYLQWLQKLTGRDFEREHLRYSSVESAAGDIPVIVARGFEEHGRCPECGWFGGHCSHTAVLGSDGRYHSPEHS